MTLLREYVGSRAAFVTQGAYHIRSTAPVTVYQFNPLDYTNGTAYSYTNDSSLLLPVNVLTGNFVIAAWQPYMYAGYPYPSMMTIVGTADDAQAFADAVSCCVVNVLAPGETFAV